MNESLFQPLVYVNDEGKIDIDWTSSFVHSIEIGSGKWVDDIEKHAELLNSVLGPIELSEPSRLRRLADYIETN